MLYCSEDDCPIAVSHIGPDWRRDRYKVMAEVNKLIDNVPVIQAIRLSMAFTLNAA